MKIKICGIRDLAAARAVADSGADAAGFVFADSPRRVEPDEARRIAGDLPSGVQRVAVFRLADPRDIRRVVERFPADRIQVEVSAEVADAGFGPRLLPVVHDDGSLPAQLARLAPGIPIVLEAEGRGGRGRRPHWERAAAIAQRRPVMLAGGLRPENVRDAIRAVRPWGVDVSSGVETSPGRKSARLIEAFVAAARRGVPVGTMEET